MENTTENITNKKYHNKLGVGLFHLDPRWCSTYDFKSVADLGMYNSFRFTPEAGTGSFIRGALRAKETGDQVWFCAAKFNSKKETIEEYMAKLDKQVNALKKAEVWDTVVGFLWDEPLASPDLLTMTKAVAEAYGKRIFPVFAIFQIAGERGNLEDPDYDRVIKKEYSEYFTDVAFDVYGYDFRVPLSEEKKKNFFDRYGVEVETAEEALQFYTDKMMGLMVNPDKVRIWYFPCAYRCRISIGGPRADEDFCIQSLEGYKNLLLKQKNPGGLYSYGYKSWDGEDGHLDWWLDEDNPERWVKYIEASKKVCDELKDIDINLF